VYTTPKSYLDLIDLYLSILKKSREEMGKRHNLLSQGLNKLRETNEIVAVLQQKLEKLQPELKQKAQETEQLLKKVFFVVVTALS